MTRCAVGAAFLALAVLTVLTVDFQRQYEIVVCCDSRELQISGWGSSGQFLLRASIAFVLLAFAAAGVRSRRAAHVGAMLGLLVVCVGLFLAALRADGPDRSSPDGETWHYRSSGDVGSDADILALKAAVRELLKEDQAVQFAPGSALDIDARLRRIYAQSAVGAEIRAMHRVLADPDEFPLASGGETVVDRFAGARVDGRQATVLALGHQRWDETGNRGTTQAMFWWLRLVRERDHWKLAEVHSNRLDGGDPPDWLPG